MVTEKSKHPRIGILGGSFDPVHRTHVDLAERARDALGLDRVLLIPAAHPPHKLDRRLSSDADRLAMLKLALEGREGLEVDDRELRRGGISYTIDTVEDLLAQYPGAEIYLIIGGDNLADIAGWRRFPDLARQVILVAFRRPGSPQDVPLALRETPGLTMEVLAAPLSAVSSTEIRKRAAEGASLAGLVPPPVAEYIRRKRLYGANK
ncbi:MAG TPA: nicotinate (nicotinamide) nucleotide adenylyltransferase [Planctomycetes bacterium]|nr:nicotinate (nicotinamide) nucleotide adenylyltransferase [Planctomycetota bacterium]